ncbi:MAG: hypothetical protein IKS41_05415 [Alphaproteobacteria bacterium]|nr:hypothetical protein [Alphaproteobacteria bacterium]
MQINNQESGRTMMEMIGVIAIIGVLTVGAISAVNFGLESFRVSSAFSMVENTAAAVSDLYSWKREFPTNAEAKQMRDKICDNKVFDDTCLDQENAATIPTAWGYLMVEPDSASQFKITLTNVPYMSCNQLMTMSWTNATLDSKLTCKEDGDAKTDMVFYGN